MKKHLTIFVFSIALSVLLASCSSSNIIRTTKSTRSNSSGKFFKKEAEVSYYADKFNGRKTADGTTFSNSKLTAAHRTLPFGTKLKVTNLANNESVVVEVNDRGPQKTSRELDLSKRAFMEITDNKNHGLLKVKIEIIK
jgi:rare lipoprotein A